MIAHAMPSQKMCFKTGAHNRSFPVSYRADDLLSDNVMWKNSGLRYRAEIFRPGKFSCWRTEIEDQRRSIKFLANRYKLKLVISCSGYSGFNNSMLILFIFLLNELVSFFQPAGEPLTLYDFLKGLIFECAHTILQSRLLCPIIYDCFTTGISCCCPLKCRRQHEPQVFTKASASGLSDLFTNKKVRAISINPAFMVLYPSLKLPEPVPPR